MIFRHTPEYIPQPTATQFRDKFAMRQAANSGARSLYDDGCDHRFHK
jgi:hypothetical protein